MSKETSVLSRSSCYSCTYVYAQRRVKAGATTVEVTYEGKSETMKVTSCRPTGYGKPQYGYGHQEKGGVPDAEVPRAQGGHPQGDRH